MKSNKRFFIVLLCLFGIPCLAQNREYWEAELNTGVASLPLTLEIIHAEDTTGILGSPAQTEERFNCSKIRWRNDSLLFSVRNLGVVFRGALSESRDSVNGMFNQGLLRMPLTFVKVNRLQQVNRPQTPDSNVSYIQEEVSFRTPGVNYTFNGTLTYPDKSKRYPVCIMITGSGLQNRDEEIFQHKPFAVIADHLAKKSIAVLRYDDRGYGSKDTALFNATTLDYAQDVMSAVEFLKTHPNIDTAMIGLIGHSEGGLIAPIVASERKDIAFIVLLAGPGVKGMDVLIEQNKAILSEMNYSQDDIEKQLEMLKNRSHESMNTPWMSCFLDLDPQPYLSRLTIPVLALNGTKDLQVLSKQNLPAIEKALKKAGNKKYSVMEMEGLNHLFQQCDTGLVDEYYTIEQTISPKVLDIITQFILEQTN